MNVRTGHVVPRSRLSGVYGKFRVFISDLSMGYSCYSPTFFKKIFLY